MNFIEINKNNVYLIKEFLSQAGSSLETFTYFDTRDINVTLEHKFCILLFENESIIGYGHIEYKDNKNWLGICLVESQKGKGYGKEIMNKLIGFCKENNINPISLSVKKINTIAKNLYEKMGFITYSENKLSYFMELKYVR